MSALKKQFADCPRWQRILLRQCVLLFALLWFALWVAIVWWIARVEVQTAILSVLIVASAQSAARDLWDHD